MAIVETCDHCRELTQNVGELASRGFVIKRQYCAVCLPMIDQYLADIDVLHDEVTQLWSNGLKEIRQKHQKKGGDFPDV